MAFDPSRKKAYTTTEDVVQVYKLDYIPPCDIVDYDMDDNDDLEKFIKDCEKMVRQSFEYQSLIMYLRNYMNMNHCSFIPGASNVDTSAIKIHIHHTPLNLYEIVSIVLEKRRFWNESVLIEDVAKEVCYVHYCVLVGLIPLSETVHELVHNEYIFIPNDVVYGNFEEFLQMYKPYMENMPQIMEKMDRIREFTRIYNEAENMQIIQPKYIYLEYGAAYKLPALEDVKNLLKNRMNDLVANSYSMEQVPLITFLPEDEKDESISLIALKEENTEE